jgi:hypothetical protein
MLFALLVACSEAPPIATVDAVPCPAEGYIIVPDVTYPAPVVLVICDGGCAPSDAWNIDAEDGLVLWCAQGSEVSAWY